MENIENLVSLENILQNEHLLVPRIFTGIQLRTLKKKLQGKSLNSSEKTYYYKFIKQKLKAILAVAGIYEPIVTGQEHIILSRLPEAARIVKLLEKKYRNKRIMISGSFLFDKKYHDIDIFVFTRYRKEDYRLKHRGYLLHINFLNENVLNSMFFTSISKISVSNFQHLLRQKFKVDLKTFLQQYELLIKLLMETSCCVELKQELRIFFLNALYVGTGSVPDSKQLSVMASKNELINSEFLSDIFINTLHIGYSAAELRQELQFRIRDYEALLKQYNAAENILIYVNTYKKVLRNGYRTCKNTNHGIIGVQNTV